jgi:hypothetical protein
MSCGKELKDYTFDELVDSHTQHAHSELLREGGKGLRRALWLAMTTAMDWKGLQIQKELKRKR